MLRQYLRSQSIALCVILSLFLAAQTGCQALTFRIKGVPAAELAPRCLAVPKRGLVPIKVTKLAQPQPDAYRLGPGDIVGIYIPGIIPFQDPTADPTPPPVYYPEAGSELPPSIGLPFIVLENGKVTLPSVQPVAVDGLSIEEATEAIRAAYAERRILKDENIIPLVTLFKPRTYSVMVVREDTGGPQDEQAANGSTIQLPAYKNDVLHALLATGGMPGLRAENEVKVYRDAANFIPSAGNGGILRMSDGGFSPPVQGTGNMDTPDIVIPLRIYEGEQINIPTADITLHDGDVVYISNRTTEVFYTSGMLPGGEHQLPRDYDIDIFEAMSIAGYSYGQSQSGGGGGGGMGGIPPGAGLAPTQLFIFRERLDGTEYTIKIDLEKAVADDRERLLVQSGDKLFLRYSPVEESMTFGMYAFFLYGIRYFFNN